jgi:hypothetical protein
MPKKGMMPSGWQVDFPGSNNRPSGMANNPLRHTPEWEAGCPQVVSGK